MVHGLEPGQRQEFVGLDDLAVPLVIDLASVDARPGCRFASSSIHDKSLIAAPAWCSGVPRNPFDHLPGYFIGQDGGRVCI